MPSGKTLIIGLGNPILGDDGVGWRVAAEVKRLLTSDLISKIEVDTLSLGGLSLMERLIGYDQAILIDAMDTGREAVGSVSTFKLEELPDPMAGHTASAHDATLITAIKAGRSMGASLPDTILIIAIEARNVYDFSEELSPLVAAAVPEAVEKVMELLAIFQ